MNARELLDEIERDLAAGNFAPSELEDAHILLRALRLLAAAEANDGTTAERTEEEWDNPAIYISHLEQRCTRLAARVAELEDTKDGAYLERNRLVALLASMFPSGVKKTAIEGWSDDWHSCVYIDFPWGQASWHYHDSHAHLFDNLTPYRGEWDGHTTEQKYAAIDAARGSKP